MRRRTKFGLFVGVVAVVLGILACIPAKLPGRVLPILRLELGPETTIVTQPLNDLGFPDYVPVVDQIVGEDVKPEENFWALFDETLEVEESGKAYSDALKKWAGFERTSAVQFVSSSRAFRQTPELADELESARRGLWKPVDSPGLVDWLTKNDEPLRIAVEASARPKAYAPVVSLDPEAMLLGTLLPYAQQCRDVARALTARATLRMSDRRYDDAWRDLLATLRIANHQFSGFCLIEHLVGVSIFSTGMEAVTVAITNEPGAAEMTRDRWKSVAGALDVRPSVDHLSRSERCNLVQMHLMLIAGFDMSDNSEGRKTTLLNALWHRTKRRVDQLLVAVHGDVNEGLRYTNTFWDKVDATLKKTTYAEQMEAWQHLEAEYFPEITAAKRSRPATDLKTVAVKTLAPAMGQFIVAQARMLQRRLLMHAAFVAEIHFRRTGRDVERGDQLQELAKQYSTEAGIECPTLEDVFTGEPLRLKKVDGILTIYAVGQNAVDDGGVLEERGADDVLIHLVRNDELRPPPPPLAIEPLSEDDFDALLDGLEP